MAIRTIVTKEDPVLYKKCHPVTIFDEKLWTLLDDMADTMYEADGAGRSALLCGGHEHRPGAGRTHRRTDGMRGEAAA